MSPTESLIDSASRGLQLRFRSVSHAQQRRYIRTGQWPTRMVQGSRRMRRGQKRCGQVGDRSKSGIGVGRGAGTRTGEGGVKVSAVSHACTASAIHPAVRPLKFEGDYERLRGTRPRRRLRVSSEESDLLGQSCVTTNDNVLMIGEMRGLLERSMQHNIM